MLLGYKKARSLEESFLIPVAIFLLVLSFGCLLVTIHGGIRLPVADWPAESEADQFEVLRRVEASGIFIIVLALCRKTFASDDSSLLLFWRDVLNSVGVLFQMCCATLGLTNGVIYLLNLAIMQGRFHVTPVLPFPILPLVVLGAGLYVSLWPAMSDAEPE